MEHLAQSRREMVPGVRVVLGLHGGYSHGMRKPLSSSPCTEAGGPQGERGKEGWWASHGP